MNTVRDRIDEAVQLLADCSDTPRADAEFMMAHLLGVPRSRLPMHLQDEVDVPEFRIYVERRMACEPVPYILGEWEFFSIPIKTRAPVLVPRPETEHLVEVVLEGERGSIRAASRILELCTGTGCVSIALAKNLPGARITATDIADDALALASENVQWHSLDSMIEIRRGDLYEALLRGARFDVICANPPYVEDADYPGLSASIRLYEDPCALLAGTDGLDCIRRIVDGSHDWLVPGGLLALEIGERQYDRVRALLEHSGYRDIGVRNDLGGIQRIVHATRALS